MKPLDTAAVDDARLGLRRIRAQVAAMRRALEQSMDVPGGMEWESQVSAVEEPETAEPLLPKSRAQEEREERWRAEFRRNWPGDEKK